MQYESLGLGYTREAELGGNLHKVQAPFFRGPLAKAHRLDVCQKLTNLPEPIIPKSWPGHSLANVVECLKEMKAKDAHAGGQIGL